MRSQRADCTPYNNASHFIIGPQLVGALGAGDTIYGIGYSMSIGTTCSCYNMTETEMVDTGLVTSEDRQNLITSTNSTDSHFLYLSNVWNSTEKEGISMNIILGNTQVCGGYSAELIPICTTRIYDTKDVEVASTYLTDGTTASIALVKQEQVSINPTKTVTFESISFAYTSLMKKGVTYPLTGFAPGIINSLLYWTTSDILAINPGLLEPGIETTVAMLLRGGIERTFSAKGSDCPRLPVVRDDQCIMYLTDWGRAAVYISGVVQILFSIFALVLASTWFWNTTPLGPAINIIQDPTYFFTMLCESPFASSLQFTANAQRHVIWQTLDTVVKVGESVDWVDEPVGKIKMDRYVCF
jgi:hypothetical protein